MKWAANLPLASELFDFKINLWGSRELKKLDKVKSLKERWDELNPFGITEQFIADALKYEEVKRKEVLWYIVRRLSKPFICNEHHAGRLRRHTLMIDEYRKFDVAGILKAQKLLARYLSLSTSGIITTNYDMIVEYALGTKYFNYGVVGQKLIGRGPYPTSEWRKPVVLKGNIPVAKIHGSVSWDYCNCYTNGRRGITGDALIVAPSPEKVPPESLKHVWDLARDILSKSSRMVVFGFAFNPYDEAVLSLIRQSGKNIASVLSINTAINTDYLIKVFPSAKIVQAFPPTAGLETIQGWEKEWLR